MYVYIGNHTWTGIGGGGSAHRLLSNGEAKSFIEELPNGRGQGRMETDRHIRSQLLIETRRTTETLLSPRPRRLALSRKTLERAQTSDAG
jgi:hypothetical protein